MHEFYPPQADCTMQLLIIQGAIDAAKLPDC